MSQTFENTGQDKPKEAVEEAICALCRSPLIQEAIEAGKCQCCGQPIKPKDKAVQRQ